MSATHTEHLRSLAGEVAEPYVERAGAVAALVAGSVASGCADEWSDIDLILFYDAWPGAEAIADGRDCVGGTATLTIGGDPSGPVHLEQFLVDGVACQLVHQTLDAWRETAAIVLEQLDVTSPVQKALDGVHGGLVLAGQPVIAGLRAAAAYPEALRRAMVEGNLDVFPLWRMQDALARRDADLWQRGELVAGLSKVLAILAGVNRVWFSTFQLKHVAALADRLDRRPRNLAERIELALDEPMSSAARELERLVDETLNVVERELPDVDVSALRRHIGQRQQPWTR